MKQLLSKKQLEEIVDMYNDRVFQFIWLKTSHYHDAQDIQAKTWSKFFTYASKKPIESATVKSFLLTIAYNTIRDLKRRSKILQFFSIASQEDSEVSQWEKIQFNLSTEQTKLFEKIDDKNLCEVIKESLVELPVLQRETFYLHYLEGLTFKEIASIHDVSINSVLSRARYAIQKIRDNLKEKTGVVSYENM